MNREYKYQVGDIVTIKGHVVMSGKMAAILEREYFARSGDDKIGVLGYRIMICGIPSKAFIYYEHEIEKL
jgi:hypothetical protein